MGLFATQLTAAVLRPLQSSAFESHVAAAALELDLSQTSLIDSVLSAPDMGPGNEEASDRDTQSFTFSEIDSLGLHLGAGAFTDNKSNPDGIFPTIGIDLSCPDCQITTSTVPVVGWGFGGRVANIRFDRMLRALPGGRYRR